MENNQTDTAQTFQHSTAEPRPPEMTGETKTRSGKQIALMVAGPLLGVVVIVFLYALVSFFSSLVGVDAANSLVVRVVNVILFMIGVAVVALGPISFIVGVVFLIMRLSSKKQ